MILGTAGHVDHGKTALVRALTGVDTDRLAEEKRRGITIDLGFAPLRLDEHTSLGVVDVPGHEAFVRNMLAGATGVDLALLVVAADEGVMPQTREHLAILQLLGIRGGVIALTKSDLVDAAWLDLVRDDVAGAVKGTPLAGAPMVTTSVVSGDGLDALRAALAAAARALPERDARDLFRLPVDRAFTVRGTGTVVTGTVWSGSLARDATVQLLPAGRIARVRGIESHGASRPQALPGTRTAIALAGVDVHEVPRGTVVVEGEGWICSETLLAEVALLAGAPRAIGPRTAVRFHLGTTEVGARIVVADGALVPGTRAEARIALDAPVVARAGDRFVLRSASPLATIGGGTVGDPAPAHRRARVWAQAAPTARERLERALAGAGVLGVAVAALPVRLGVPPEAVDAVLTEMSERARRVGDRIVAAESLRALSDRLVALVGEHHRRAPLEPGAPLQSIRAQLGAPSAVAELVVGERVASGALEVIGGGALVRAAGWAPRLSAAEHATLEALLSALARAGREPPAVAELEASFGAAVLSLLKHLERDGRVVQVESDRFYLSGVVEELVARLRGGMIPGREYSPAELRDTLGFSRKFLIPFLEYCDRSGFTVRRGAARVVGPARPALA